MSRVEARSDIAPVPAFLLCTYLPAPSPGRRGIPAVLVAFRAFCKRGASPTLPVGFARAPCVRWCSISESRLSDLTYVSLAHRRGGIYRTGPRDSAKICSKVEIRTRRFRAIRGGGRNTLEDTLGLCPSSVCFVLLPLLPGACEDAPGRGWLSARLLFVMFLVS